MMALAAFGPSGSAAAQGTSGTVSGEVYVPPGYGDPGPSVPPPPSGAVTLTPGTPGALPASGYTLNAGASMTTPTPHLETRTRQTSIRALWIPGLIALPASWLLTWSISSTALPLYGDAIEYSFIPVIGPWLMLTQPLNGYDGFAIAMGLVQDTAAILLILGLVLREEVEDQVWVMADLGEGRRFTFDAFVGPGSAMMNGTLTF